MTDMGHDRHLFLFGYFFEYSNMEYYINQFTLPYQILEVPVQVSKS